MLKLHIVQAECGDCLVIEYGTFPNLHYILVDGGPADIYQSHLHHKLREINSGSGKLDVAVLSHVDDDHVAGILDLLYELQQQRANHSPETIAIGEIWHNSFSTTLGEDVERRFHVLKQGEPSSFADTATPEPIARSIAQGDALTQAANMLRIPLNPEFLPHGLVCVENAPAELLLDNLKVHIVGPTQKNLKSLRRKWLKWLKDQEKRNLLETPARAALPSVKPDESVPNLSSIMLLVEAEGKSILLTGDGRSQDLLEGLTHANLLDADGKLHVDLLKLPHHGSQRNVTKRFFSIVTADKYVICANGKDDNPDWNTLKWIVEAAHQQRRAIEIWVTNLTPSIHRLIEEYPTNQYAYRLVELSSQDHAMIVALSDETVAQ